jgi:hypothetical protein
MSTRREFVTLLGGVATRGARAATRQSADYRLPGSQYRIELD